MLLNTTRECQEFILKLLLYNPDERPTTRQALNSPFLKDLRMLDEDFQQLFLNKIQLNLPTHEDNNSTEERKAVKINNSKKAEIKQSKNNAKEIKKKFKYKIVFICHRSLKYIDYKRK